MAKFSSVLFFSFFLTIVCISNVHGCGPQDWKAAKNRMKSMISASPAARSFPARLLRAGFHDCFPLSCDVSLQFELDRSENNGIAPIIDFLRQVKGDSCVSMGDLLKIGMIVSNELSDAPLLNCPLGNRVDATSANPSGQLPDQNEDAQTILGKFKKQGFNSWEAMAGNFGGHSLGFSKSGTKPFTSKIDKFGKSFTKYVVGLPRTKKLRKFALFNHLASDVALAKSKKRIAKRFSKNRYALNKKFIKFMTKLCRK